MIERLAHWLTKHTRIVIIVALVLLIPAAVGYIATRVNYDILSYLPEDQESVQGERLLEDPFNDAATSILIVEDMPAGYISDLVSKIEKIDHVTTAFWLSDAVGVQIPTQMIPSSIRDTIYSDNATMIIIQFDKPGSSNETMEAIEQLRKVCNKQCFLAGFSAIIVDTRDLMLDEMPLYLVIAVILTLIVMLISFESWILPFIFLSCIGIAIVYNMGSNIIFGEISYITQAMAAILQLGVTMDYSIFLYHRYEEEKLNYDTNEDAMATAIVAAFASLSGSSLTTVAGFIALCFMKLTLGMDIGLVMAKGVILGIISVVLILPAFLLRFDSKIQRYKHKSIMPDFTNVSRWIIKHRKIFVCIFLISIVPAIYSMKNTGVYYKMDATLPDTLNSRIGNQKLKDDFGMATEHFIVMDADISGTDMAKMEAAIENVKGIKDVLTYHKMLGDGIPEYFLPDDINKIFKCGDYQLMILTSNYEVASDEIADQLAEITSIVKQYDPTALVTGEGAMTNDLIDITDVDFKVTNYISIASIFIIVMVVFGSISVPVILILAIELAIMINEGIPYWQGTIIPFVAPTVISALQLGATVDYAILMSTRFREEIRNGKDRVEAAIIASSTSNPSIITSSCVLFCATLGVTIVSSMDIVKSICSMIARGAIISAVISFLIVPCLLCVCEPVIRKTSLQWAKVKQKSKS